MLVLSNKRAHLCNLFIKRCLSSSEVRVRFAPSPTGFLHLGGLRTALYNYLFAKSKNGKFILRIEDTDQTRLVQGATEALQEDLEWAGIHIHEGPNVGGAFGPYVQSQRLDLYSEHVKTLLKNGSAYQCFCSDKRLDLLRREAVKNREVPKYDNRCRQLSKKEAESKIESGQTACIRFKIKPGIESFDDLIYGKISYDITLNEGDPVIVKSDGFPTYHFANVVDDYLMKISHVLRGVEWQISTTKHILLYRAFGWEPPKFGHLPLLMNADGTKLSKRQGDIKIGHYRDNNIFSIALLNYIVDSGGGFAKDLDQSVKTKCYSIDELAQQFTLRNINSHSGKLMPERLLEFNKLELKRRLLSPLEETKLIEEVQVLVKENYQNKLEQSSLQIDPNHVKKILHWASDRIVKTTDLISKDLSFVWVRPNNYQITSQVQEIEKLLSSLPNQTFAKDDLNVFLKQFCKDESIKFGPFMKDLRSILSGLKEGPGVAEMMDILGKENTIERITFCLQKR